MSASKSEAHKILEKEDLVELLKQYTSYEIAEMFNTNYGVVNKVANKQFQRFSIEEAARKARFIESQKLVKEDELNCGNAWHSLKNSDIYKKLTNEDNRK